MRLRAGSMRARTVARLMAKPSSSDDPGRPQDDRIDHRIAARHVEQPGGALVGGRLQRGAHGELIAARLDLERHDQGAPPRVPIEAEIGVVDRHADVVVFAIDDGAGVRDQLALHHLRRAVGQNVGADARRQRQVGIDGAFVEPQRQQNVAGGNLARLDADRAYAVGERAHRRAQHPGPLGIVRIRAGRSRRLASGRVRLALIRSKVQRLPLRRSSTMRLPFLRPSSRRS